MHETQFQHHPRLDGMAYGFSEQTLNENGRSSTEATSNSSTPCSPCCPSTTSDSSWPTIPMGTAATSPSTSCSKRSWTATIPKPRHRLSSPPTKEFGNADRVAGSYRVGRSNYTGFEKVLTLLTGARVSANKDGSITTTGGYLTLDLDATEQRWVEVEPLLFRAENGREQIAFREDGEGRITYLTGDADPTISYEKVTPYEAPRLQVGLLMGSLAVLLLTTVVWPVGALISRRFRKRYGVPAEDKTSAKVARRARVLAWAVSALILLFVIGMVVVFSNAGVTLANVSPYLVAVLTLPSWLQWGPSVSSSSRRCPGSAGTGVSSDDCTTRWWRSMVVFIALLGYYNLLGFQF